MSNQLSHHRTAPVRTLAAYVRSPTRCFALRARGYNLDVLMHRDHVAVFEPLKLCFNRIKKSGNTTVSAFLADLCSGSDEAVRPGFKKELLKPRIMSVQSLMQLDGYYSLVICRNPYARALSCFLHRYRRRHAGDDFSPTPEGLTRYLRFLRDGGFRVDRHFWPQADLLYQPLERYSRVGRLETLVQDMRLVLSDIGRDPALAEALAKPHAVEAGSAKLTSSSDRLHAFYTPESIQLARQLYATDFEAFGYSTDL
jgi:hypothetical protein